jgi:hypothetical protein
MGILSSYILPIKDIEMHIYSTSYELSRLDSPSFINFASFFLITLSSRQFAIF